MNMQTNHIDILDTTLRDGSYTIGYQFTADETALIAQGLELAGVKYIEIGHGLGLGADRAGKGAQAVSDIEYMHACKSSIRNSMFGFFFIPGIGNLSDIELLADEGGKFVRIGVALESAEQALHVIEAARRRGLETWVNMMKTYAYPVHECREWASRFVQAGADGVYIVDSAGGMLPQEVAAYTQGIKEAFDEANRSARIGFHGHDNLSLSAACSLSAVQAGCDIVDGSLLGIGRSIGNAATEVLAMVLARAGYETGINPWFAADLAEKTIRPFLEQRWRHSSLDQALGYTQIHSGFLPMLEKVSAQKQVGIRDLVLALANDARRNVTEADAILAADSVKGKAAGLAVAIREQEGGISPPPAIADLPDMPRQSDLARYAAEVSSQSLRMNRPAAIVIAGPWQENAHNKVRLQQIRLLPHAVVGAIEVGSPADLERALLDMDGTIDIVFLDKTPRARGWYEMVQKLESREWRSRILPYADEIACLIGACHIVTIEAEKRGVRKIAVLGEGERAQMVRTLLPYWGMEIVDAGQSPIMVVASRTEGGEPFSRAGLILVYDLISGVIGAEIAHDLLANGVEVVRLDGRVAMAGEVLGLLDAQRLVDHTTGRGYMHSLSVVAGGAWGREGDVIVNCIKEPTEVIGIADGNGGVKSHLSDTDKTAIENARKILRGNVLGAINRFTAWQELIRPESLARPEDVGGGSS